VRPSRPAAAIGAALAALTAAATITVAAPPPAGAMPTPALPHPDAFGIDTIGPLRPVTNLSDRMFEATMTTPALFEARGVTTPADVSAEVRVRVLLPDGYDPARARGYDVLYLLHGGGGDYLQWSVRTDWLGQNGGAVADVIPGYPGIVVMPEGGKAGWYTDWAGHTDGNFAPLWETFHVDQLVPWVDANFNTAATRASRAVAGLSMGGLGALRYAALHPDVYGAVGAFSAGTTLDDPDAWDIVDQSMLGFGATIVNQGLFDGHYRVNPPWPGSGHENDRHYRLEAVFGPSELTGQPADQRWRDVSPAGGLAPAYAAYDGRMAVYSGGITAAGGVATTGETGIGAWNLLLHDRLGPDDLDVPHRWCGGTGGHDMSAWRADLVDFVDFLADGDAGACPNVPPPS